MNVIQIGDVSPATKMTAGEAKFGPVYFRDQRDGALIEKLLSSAAGTLKIDGSAGDLGYADIVRFRYDVYDVVLRASNMREASRASNSQLAQAETARRKLWHACQLLRGDASANEFLQSVFAIRSNDGEQETNNFSEELRGVNYQLVPVIQRLESCIRVEREKTPRKGERKKRLRWLIESLADWWMWRGGTIAPVVQVRKVRLKGLPKSKANVIGHEGAFLNFCRALLVDLNDYTDAAITSAVVNVYKAKGRRPEGR